MESRDHYNEISDRYENLWIYSEDFINYLSNEIIELLDLSSEDILIDVGCGTGLYSKEINRKVGFSSPVVGVDPSQGMLDEVKHKQNILAVKDKASDFSKRRLFYDKVLIKEVIHHVPKSKWSSLFRGIYENIKSDGKILLLMLPPEIDYPLFDEAISRYEESQPHFEEVAREYRNAGFKTSVTDISYDLSIEKDRYISMVEKRYMSLLSSFSEKEIKEGIKEIKEKYDGEVLSFEDTFISIIGEKYE